MKRSRNRAPIILRGCAGRSNHQERKSHAVRRVRPDALRLVRGLGEPQQAHRDIQKDIPMTCLPMLSEISDNVSKQNLFLSKTGLKKYEIIYDKKVGLDNCLPKPTLYMGQKFLIRISIQGILRL